MRIVWAATLVLAAVCAAPSSAISLQGWEGANRAAIAKIHSPQGRAAAQRALQATMARIGARASAPIVVPRRSPRAVAAAELAVPGRYDLRDPSVKAPGETAWQRLMDWIGAQWNRLMDALFGHVKLGDAGAALLGDVLLALAAAALIAVLARFLIVLQFDRAGRTTAFTPLEHRRNAHALYLQACALAQDGAYDAAVQRLFLAAITALDLRGVLRENASATVGDMRRVLRGRTPALVAAFDDVAAPFVDAIYAETPIAMSRWTQAKAAYARLTASETTV